MKKWLVGALAAQVAFFTGWAAWLFWSHRDAQEIFLATAPVDPRDYLSGDYVALDYPIARPAGPGCEEIMREMGDIYVELAPSTATARLVAGEVPLHQAVRCGREASSDGLWVRGRMTYPWNPRVAFGTERFYVSNTSPLRNARSGDVVARAGVNRRGQLRLRALEAVSRTGNASPS